MVQGSSPSKVLRSQNVQSQSAHIWDQAVTYTMEAAFGFTILVLFKPPFHARPGFTVPGFRGPGCQLLIGQDLEALTSSH